MHSLPWYSTASNTSVRYSYRQTRSSQGPLGAIGYTVSDKSDLSRTERRALLRYAFECELPKTLQQQVIDLWGPPKSLKRHCSILLDLAGHIERNSAQNCPSRQQAIERWKEDESWVRSGYPEADPSQRCPIQTARLSGTSRPSGQHYQ